MVYINGQITAYTKETGKTTKYQDMVNTPGMMEEHIKGIGKITICMVKVFTNGLMVVSMKVSTSTIKNMVMVFIPIQMADHIKVIGPTVNNMEKEHL